jgi:hypothetical protein
MNDMAGEARAITESVADIEKAIGALALMETRLADYTGSAEALSARLRKAVRESVGVAAGELNDFVQLTQTKGFDEAMGKLERLVSLGNHLRDLAGEGWLDRILATMLEKQ